MIVLYSRSTPWWNFFLQISVLGDEGFLILSLTLYIDFLLQILCGEDDVFLDMKDLCECWYQMLVSRLFYQNPAVKAFDLQRHAQVACSLLYKIILFVIKVPIRKYHLDLWWF